MNKFLKYCVFVLLLITSYSYAQIGWFWQNPSPAGSRINDCFFYNQNTGYVVGSDGLVLKTSNSGTSWNQLNTQSVKTYSSVYFVNNQKGYIITGDINVPSDNYLLVTNNGGSNWTKSYTFTNQHLSKILFLNENTGFITGGNYWLGGRIHKTTNGGINWLQYSPDPTTNFIYSIFFINNDTGYVAGADGKILKTTNCGSNWISLNSGTNFLFNDIYFTNSDTGFVCGSAGKILKTTNSGGNWSLLNSSTNINLFSIRFINSQTGFTAGGTNNSNIGKLLKTTNSGLSWDSVVFANKSNFGKIYSINNSLFLMGYWGAFYKSSNTGGSWESIYSSISENDLYKTCFINNNTGILVGTSGYISRTTNGGNNWNQINLNTTYSIYNCKFINGSTGFILGSNGFAMRSTNAGNNWQNFVPNSNNTLPAIDFIDSNTGCILSNYGDFGAQYGYVLKTTNGGLNWSNVFTWGNHLSDIEFNNSTTGFITTKNAKLLKTVNRGSSWSSVPYGGNEILTCIYFYDSINGFIGSADRIFKTTDGGNNWINVPVQLSPAFVVESIYFTNINTGFLVGSTYAGAYGESGAIFKTIDRGNSWFLVSDKYNLPYIIGRKFKSITFLNDSTGFITGDKGIILKTSNGGYFPISVQNISSEIPQKFILSQNYPNPFNPQTKIKFDVPKVSFTKLIIYDLLGREVTTLVNEELKPGTYQADWDASGFSSGVYFYKITAGDFVETKKMVLMK
jgi:photosystem II stability/assembly factor-like uncharacterized protein